MKYTLHIIQILTNYICCTYQSFHHVWLNKGMNDVCKTNLSEVRVLVCTCFSIQDIDELFKKKLMYKNYNFL